MAKEKYPPMWIVYRTRGAKREGIGRVRAKDQKEALRKAYEECKVRPADRFRISVERE